MISKAVSRCGSIMADLDLMLDSTLLTATAEPLVHLSKQKESLEKAFHSIKNPYLLPLSKFAGFYLFYGYPMDQVSAKIGKC